MTEEDINDSYKKALIALQSNTVRNFRTNFDQIDQLIAEVVRLREHHVEDNDALQLPPEDTRPPHY
mgnify:CR=1 FL=1